MAGYAAQDGDGITRISPAALIRLRHQAAGLPLHSKRVRAQQGGAYLSPFKGRGMEFAESRIYLAGDDIRNMDWRVTARTGKPHTKIFQEERERPVFLWLDLNPSMFFATRGAFKSVIAARVAALLAWSTVSANDRLGACIFAGDQFTHVRPARGKSAALELIGRTCKHPAWTHQDVAQKKSLTPALAQLRRLTRPGSLVFLISDFRDDAGDLDEQARAHLVNLARHNDVVLVQIHDPVEAALPAIGHCKVSHGEQELLLNTHSRTLREAYRARYEQRRETLQTLCRRYKMHCIPLSTGQDTLETLRRGLGVRATQAVSPRAT